MSDVRFYFNICLIGLPVLAVCVAVAIRQYRHNRYVCEKYAELLERAHTCKQEEVEGVLLDTIQLANLTKDPVLSMKVTGLIQYLMGREWKSRK